MARAVRFSLLALGALLGSRPAAAQTDAVWGAVAVSLFGDRVPALSPELTTLTPLGAQQMFAAGQALRQRYVQPGAGGDSSNRTRRTIVGIAPDRTDPRQTQAYGSGAVHIDQSVQALMAGLYPPAGNSSADTLRNGSAVGTPLNGMQYSYLSLVGEQDPAYVYVAGHDNCPAWQLSQGNYARSDDFAAARSGAQSFYASLGAALGGVDVRYYAEGSSPSLSSAYEVWEFLAYQAEHGAAVTANASTIGYARALADGRMWQRAGNATADSGMRPIAGRTLLTQVLETLWVNNKTAGRQAKLNTFVVDVEPLLGLFSVLGLPDHDRAFTRIPDPASTLVFELFSQGNSSAATNGTPAYPSDLADLRVRVLFQNGTAGSDNGTTGLRALPVFDRGDEPSIVDLRAFTRAAAQAAVPDAAAWCLACNSYAAFCAGLTGGAVGLPGGGANGGGLVGGNRPGQGGCRQRVSPPVAGVIGAVVTLAVLGLAVGAAALLGGFRVRREPRGQRRNSPLGGFKGAEKLASDPDLPKSGNRASASTIGASVVQAPSQSETSHRRVESWEMRGGGARDARPSFEADTEGVKELERV